MDEEDDATGKPDSEAGGELMDEATTSGTGEKEARSSAAEAESKVARPFLFLAGGSSFDFNAKLQVVSLRAVLRLLDKGAWDISVIGEDREMDGL